ncbi:hypothetical protein [Microbispora sp. CA-102843]|uniref:hypothetical protein n=1 Tax=Microbispora sp. CA-102843 TaxID=3239952 RepID=UPI003D940093
MLQTNSLEGGTNGTAITTANSGGASGNAFNYVQAATYTTAQAAHGTRSAACGTNSLLQLQWYPLTVPNGNFYGRLNFRLVQPTAGDTWAGIYLGTQDGADYYSWSAFVTVTTSGAATLRLYHYVGSTDTTTLLAEKTITVPNGTWQRLELRADNNATSTAEARWYNTMDGTTITDSVTASVAHPAGVIPWDWYGAEGRTLDTSATTVWVDDLAVADTGWLGPVVPPAIVPKDTTDQGTLTDLATVTATLPLTDGGTLTEQATIALGVTDQATLTEQATAAPILDRTDGATLTEQAVLQPALNRVDSATFTDQAQVTATLPLTDGGTLTEGVPVITITTTDTATLTEQAEVEQIVGPVTSDTATLGEAAEIAATVAVADGGTLTDTAVVVLPTVDTGILTEAAQITVLASDAATLTETATVTALLTTTDSATLGELAHAVQPVFATDTATLTEVATVISLGGDITRASPPYTDWAASTPYT